MNLLIFEFILLESDSSQEVEYKLSSSYELSFPVLINRNQC